MPTFNQLVKKGRQTSVKKSTAPALQKGYNSLKKRSTDTCQGIFLDFFTFSATFFLVSKKRTSDICKEVYSTGTSERIQLFKEEKH